MKHDAIASGKRKSVNLSLDSGVVAAAREVGINLSQVSDSAIAAAVKAERERRWRDENREAIEGWNRWYEKHGDPLAHLREL